MSTAVVKAISVKSLGALRHAFKSTIFEKCSACTSQYDRCYRQNNLNSLITTRHHFKSTFTGADANTTQIYYGLLTPQIKAVKLFSLTTSIAGLIAQPVLFYHGSSFGGIPLLVAVGSVIGFFTFVTPFLLHTITKKYVTEVHYNPSSAQYSAIVYNFFLQRKEVLFKPKDVVVPEIPGMFTSFIAKGVPLFVEARLFEEPQHYAKIMGYDKPIDFKMENTKNSIKQDKT